MRLQCRFFRCWRQPRGNSPQRHRGLWSYPEPYQLEPLYLQTTERDGRCRKKRDHWSLALRQLARLNEACLCSLRPNWRWVTSCCPLQAISIDEGGEQEQMSEIKIHDDGEQTDVYLVAHRSLPRPPLHHPPLNVHINSIAPAATIMHLLSRDVTAPIMAACASISNAYCGMFCNRDARGQCKAIWQG